MAEQFQEKTEDATPRRKREARRKGTVTRSTELVNGLVMIAFLISLPILAPKLGGAMMLGITQGLSELPTEFTFSGVTEHTWNVLRPSLLALAPLIGIAMVVGVAGNVAQVGFVMTPEPLTPTFSKINPLEGFKRLFSVRGGMEGLKAFAKSALFGYLAYQVIHAHWNQVLELSWYTASDALMIVGNILKEIFQRVAIAWLILAAIDYLFQRKQIEKQLKMTKDEVRQEFKQNEQSPELRAAMASRRRKLLKGRTAQAVRGADVVVTNPTHYAVAIKYDRASMHSPQVVAKGADFMAAKIRELAEAGKIPIVPNPPLARQLYKKCEVGDFVPRELFQAVAEVLAYVYTTLKKVKA